MPFIGIDLGGTKIEGVALDFSDHCRVIERLRIPTEATRGYRHILTRIAEVIGLLKKSGVEIGEVIGIGTPGTLDPETQRIRGSNTQCLNDKPLKADLECILDREVVMANDANCFALAEATLGAGQGYETVFGIIIGTGCGGALVHRGEVLTGCHGNAGEWGQMVIEPNGEKSVHGTRGIVEAYIAGPALEEFYRKQAGKALKLRDIFARVEQDRAARQTIDRLKEFFCRSLAAVIDIFDPHAIVVGGGVGNIDELYGTEVRARLSSLVFAPRLHTAVLKPRLGDSAGVFGAALLTGPKMEARTCKMASDILMAGRTGSVESARTRA